MFFPPKKMVPVNHLKKGVRPFRNVIHVNLGRSFNLIKTNLYLEPNDRPLLSGVDLNHFMGKKHDPKNGGPFRVQGINTRLEMSRKTSGKWKVPIVTTFAVLFVYAALFRWLWPLKKQRLLKGEIRTTTLFTGDGCLKNKKQT